MIKKGFSELGILFLKIISYLPFWFLYGLSSILYYPVYYLIKYRRKIVRTNLLNSFPEKSIQEIILIEKEFYRHLTDMLFENIKFNSLSKAELVRRLQVTGLDMVEEEYKKGRKVLLCASHYGNWEMPCLSFAIQQPGTTLVIYKPLNNKSFDDWYKYWRSRFGTVMVPMRETLRAISTYKEVNYTLCFASDQSPTKGEDSPFIPFLNQPTSVLLGIEKIAKKTGNPIYYAYMTKLGRGKYRFDLKPVCLNPKDTADLEITKLHFGILEEIIKREPAYWLWSHNRWKNKPKNAS